MKEIKMLVWLSQLGLSTALPLAGFTLLAVWLRQRFALEGWVILCGVGLGLFCAVDGFRNSLKTLERLDRQNHQKKTHSVSFNDHE